MLYLGFQLRHIESFLLNGSHFVFFEDLYSEDRSTFKDSCSAIFVLFVQLWVEFRVPVAWESHKIVFSLSRLKKVI